MRDVTGDAIFVVESTGKLFNLLFTVYFTVFTRLLTAVAKRAVTIDIIT